MSNNFDNSNKLLFTSESVTEGHPDKTCDLISDAILDAHLAQDPYARVACETAIKNGFVMVFGEITSTATVDYDTIVRNTLRSIGYTSDEMGFNANTCDVEVRIYEQSPDIALGVDTAGGNSKGDKILGAGDQGMMFGFASNETESLTALPIELAHGLALRLSALRKSGDMPYLRPDGKTQVTVEYHGGVPSRIDTVVVSTHHEKGYDQDLLEEQIYENIISAVIPYGMMDAKTVIHVNPSGRFEVGGPDADAGLTGRKIIVDTYGGMARHGGGAFSGKDATKVDRSATYAARWVAKNIVAAGLAQRCEVQVSYAIGEPQPISINVETYGTSTLRHSDLISAITTVFDLSPTGIIEDLDLRRPIYGDTAAYGHFGANQSSKPWEQINRVDELKAAVAAL